MSLGSQLKKLRNEKGYNQEQLAKLIGVAPSTLGAYERNTRECDFNTLMFFATLTKNIKEELRSVLSRCP